MAATGERDEGEERQRGQRQRLLAAAVRVVAERGYEATRVEDLLNESGVSRNAFYKIFPNKQECFLAALDQIAELSGPAVLDAYARTSGTWEERMMAMLDALARTLVEHPAAARVGWLEAYGAGPEAVERADEIDARTEAIVRGAFSECPDRAEMPPDVVAALVGGVRKMIHTRLREGREGDLPGEMPQIFDWILRYRTPPEWLRRPRRPPTWLTPEPPPPETPHERILAAVAELVADEGYRAMAITDIAHRASVSLTTFYEQFESKEDAFVAALDLGRRRAVSAVMPIYSAAPDWQHAVAAGLHTLFALFSVDTALGRLGGIGAYETGPLGMGALDAGIAGAQPLLQAGFDAHPDTPAIAAEAIGTSTYALMSRQIRRHGAQRLYEVAPTAAFIALAPFVGSDEATEVANAIPAPATARRRRRATA